MNENNARLTLAEFHQLFRDFVYRTTEIRGWLVNQKLIFLNLDSEEGGGQLQAQLSAKSKDAATRITEVIVHSDRTEAVADFRDFDQLVAILRGEVAPLWFFRDEENPGFPS